MNNRLHLFNSEIERNKGCVFDGINRAVTQVYADLGYDFPLIRPISLECETQSKKTKVKSFIFFGEEKEIEEKFYRYSLCFDRELTKEELSLWRMFKLGRISSKFYE